VERLCRVLLDRSPTVSRRRALVGLGGGLGLAGLGRATATAQDATPETCERCSPRIGEAVFVGSPDGQAIGEIVVEEFLEPFTDFDPAFSPPRGTHFATLRVTFRATGQQPMGINPGAFYLQYADHFLTGPTALHRGAQPAEPDLAAAAVEPGKTTTGLVGFTVLNGVEVVRIFYYPQGDRLFLLAELC
jgi:hypothetical protein